MKIKRLISIQRLVGKIDNDFNISESDWIPRVAAWTIDALSQMKVLPMEKKRRTLEVSDRIAQFPCEITAKELRVFDKNGVEISNGADNKCGYPINSQSSLRGGSNDSIAVIDTNNKDGVDFMKVGTIVGSYGNRKFYLQGNNIELNFETDAIQVESLEVATYHDDYYDCEVPYIYDNGTLLEALSWYCLLKYLSRGSTHPVYSLTSPSPFTNPAARWEQLKPKAATSVKNDIANDRDGWNNFFYNSTFLPRS